MSKYIVYWYKLPFHNNPYIEGYIGITNNIDRRDKEHRRNSKNTHFANAMQKYGDQITYEILHTVTKKEALDLEYAYRPDTSIGWNAAVGGEDTLSSVRKTPISLYHKDNYVILYNYNSITEAAEALGISIGSISQAKYRKNNVYGYHGWAILHDKMHDRSTTKTVQEVISERISGVKRTKPSHFKGMTNRWSAKDKERISKQHKGKTISEKQKAIVGQKNKTNPSLCRSITLIHKDNPDKSYTYHSISEASRQLKIPLSRLKSKAQRPLNRYGKDGWAITSLGSK